jgi:hypothetical protein
VKQIIAEVRKKVGEFRWKFSVTRTERLAALKRLRGEDFVG